MNLDLDLDLERAATVVATPPSSGNESIPFVMPQQIALTLHKQLHECNYDCTVMYVQKFITQPIAGS